MSNIPVLDRGFFTTVNVAYVDRGDDSVCLLPYTYATPGPHTTEEAEADALNYVIGLFLAIGDGTRVIGAQVTSQWEKLS